MLSRLAVPGPKVNEAHGRHDVASFAIDFSYYRAFAICNLAPKRGKRRFSMNMILPAVSKLPRDLRKIGANADYWYPLAWSGEIKPGKVIGRHFAGEPIALYRTADGKLGALEDRCAHRQIPLHMGVVAGQTLKCGYHGWTYDRAGACIDVP